jgi:hypothetical protein
MSTLVRCPSCGGDWAEAEVRCPSCGFEAAAEDVVASWLAAEPGESVRGSGEEAICLACGYEGPLVEGLDEGRVLCPACGTPWQKPGVVREAACPDCGKVILLTEEDRGRTIVCPGCHAFLGCLLEPDRRGRGRRPRWSAGGSKAIFEIMTLVSATALGISVVLDLTADGGSGQIMRGSAVMALSGCGAITVLRMLAPRMRRGRRFSPPGVAACLAVTVGALINLLASWDQVLTYVGPRSLLLVAALNAITPIAPAAAVAAVWMLLLFDDRWRFEPSWIDRLGRCLGLYWLLAGLIAPFARYFT